MYNVHIQCHEYSLFSLFVYSLYSAVLLLLIMYILYICILLSKCMNGLYFETSKTNEYS